MNQKVFNSFLHRKDLYDVNSIKGILEGRGDSDKNVLNFQHISLAGWECGIQMPPFLTNSSSMRYRPVVYGKSRVTIKMFNPINSFDSIFFIYRHTLTFVAECFLVSTKNVRLFSLF